VAGGQVQIIRQGPSDAPVDYLLPATAPCIPLAINADFDGSGAAGDYLPVVEIIGPSGFVIARTANDSTVLAGDDAEVSWFPGVKSGGAVTPPTLLAGLKFAYSTFIPTTVNAGAAKVIPFDPSYFVTNSPTTWSQPGFSDITFNEVGRYLCVISWKHVAAAFFATTFPAEMAPTKDPGLPTSFGFKNQFMVASTATAQMQARQWQGYTIDGSTWPTGQPLEYGVTNHTAVTLDLYAAIFIFQLDTGIAHLS
jgi:hypothetical protein